MMKEKDKMKVKIKGQERRGKKRKE